MSYELFFIGIAAIALVAAIAQSRGVRFADCALISLLLVAILAKTLEIV